MHPQQQMQAQQQLQAQQQIQAQQQMQGQQPQTAGSQGQLPQPQPNQTMTNYQNTQFNPQYHQSR
jgi:hypothetical protein